MNFNRIFGNAFLCFYLWVTMCALLLTLFRIYVPLPRSLVIYSYGMMAPYQSYGEKHQEMLAEGKVSNGEWVKIDVDAYYPVLHGEQNIRQYAAVFGYTVPDNRLEWLRMSYAKKILELEKAKGNAYSAIRISWEQWPTMTGDYRANKFPAATETSLIYQLNDE